MNEEIDDLDDDGAEASEERGPSRSQQKRDHKALRDLVRDLIGLPPHLLETLPLETELRAQVTAAKRLVPKALNREVRHIARQLVNTDPEQLRVVLARHREPHRQSVRALHAAERSRDALIEGDDAALTAVIERHPTADRQQLRQLVRAARKESGATEAPKSARKLFKLLHALEVARDPGAGESDITA